MTELVSIDVKRKAKTPKCDFCGQPEHIATLACPRVFAVTYEGEAVTVELYAIEEPPPPPEPAAAA
jgi:hypothetical protein